MANGWFERAISAQKDLDKLAEWWGRDDWSQLRAMSRDTRKETVVQRMKSELGYSNAYAWPIFKRQTGTEIMYFMIHATDHPAAPDLMSRAYRNTVNPYEPPEQLEFELGPKGPGLQTPPQATTEKSA